MKDKFINYLKLGIAYSLFIGGIFTAIFGIIGIGILMIGTSLLYGFLLFLLPLLYAIVMVSYEYIEEND